MKQFLFILAAMLLMVFVGCQPPKKYDKLENKQQQAFDDFLAKKREASYHSNNDIQKKEFFNQFEKELSHYVDTVGLFVNWYGVISDIETDETGQTTALKFTINYKPEKYREIKFYCNHLIATDSLNNDYIYLTVKNISNYMTVYFDGFIRKKNNDEVYYNWRSAGDELNIPYPDYEFWITDISQEKRSDTLSINMQEAVSMAYKINEPLKNQFIGLTTKEESDVQFNELLPLFKQAKFKLSDSEKQYIQRLSTCLTYNYLYGE